MGKERFYLFDNLKGLMIFFVVWGHILKGAVETNLQICNIYSWIYSFHMPVFVFCTGYFAKFSFKKLKHNILYPYIIFSILFFAFKIFILQGSKTISFIVPYNHLWYLLSSFFWHLTLLAIEKRKNSTKIILLIISILCMLFVGYCTNIGQILSISRTICFYPFFLFGHICSKINKETFLKIITNKKIKIITITLFIIVSIILLSGYLIYPNLTIYYHTVCFEKTNSDIIDRLLILGFNIIGLLFFLTWIPNKKIKSITHIGEKTIFIFILHYFLTNIIKKLNILNSVNCPITLSIILTILVVILTSLPVTQKLFKNFVSYPTKKQET